MTSFVCWACIEVEVPAPGQMCDKCGDHEDRAQRKRAYAERSTETHERTHERYRANLSDKGVDQRAYDEWANG